jgi:hypothetical protein
MIKQGLPSQANMGIGAKELLGGTFQVSLGIYLIKSLHGSEECSSLGGRRSMVVDVCSASLRVVGFHAKTARFGVRRSGTTSNLLRT